MADAPPAVLLRHLCRLATRPNHHASDRELLRRFAARRDGDAFAALVHRHGPLVLRVCRGVLRHEHDAEDAFQATFLVLAQKATAAHWHDSVAGWLHATAHHLALKARTAIARRRLHESQAAPRGPGDPLADLTLRELQAVLDGELARLPEKYRAPFVLCCLEGTVRDEAAQQLGWPLSVLKSRLERGRELLRARLARRGVTLAAALAGAALAGATPPAALVRSTGRAALLLAAGGSAAGVVPAAVADLIGQATRAVLLTRGRLAGAILLAACLVAAGAGALTKQEAAAQPAVAPADEPAKPPAEKPKAEPAVVEQDNTVTVSGRVLGPDGKPFEGAEVMLLNAARAKSGPDGRFRFTFAKAEASASDLNWRADPWRYAQIVAAAKGHGPGWDMLGGPGRPELTLRLVADDVPIKGRLRDLQGRPVAGASVWVCGLRQGNDALFQHAWPGLSQNVATDKDGRFTLAGVGRDRVVMVRFAGPTIEFKTVEVSTQAVADGKRVESATVEEVVRPCKPVEGTVRAKDTGKPLAGVEVKARVAEDNLMSYPYAGVTDEQGRYRIAGVPKGARYELRACPGVGQGYLHHIKQAGDSEGLKPVTLDFELRRGVPVRFRLLDKETGKPLRGLVQYDLTTDNPHWSEAVGPLPRDISNSPEWFNGHVPDKDLYFNLLVYPGPGVLMAKAEFGGRPYLKARLDPADEAKGHYPAAKGDGVNYLLPLFNAYRRVDSDQTDKPLTFDLEVDPGRTLRGTLRGPDGKPVAGATAYGLGRHYTPEGGTRGRDEALRADAFTAVCIDPKEPCTLSFIHKERKLIGHVVVKEDTKGPLAVRLEPWGAVTGRLVDGDGKPLAEVRVQLQYPSLPAPGIRPPDQAFETDREGRFRVEGLVPGMKHELTLGPVGKEQVTLSAGEALKGLAVPAGEVKELGDVRVQSAPVK